MLQQKPLPFPPPPSVPPGMDPPPGPCGSQAPHRMGRCAPSQRHGLGDDGGVRHRPAPAWEGPPRGRGTEVPPPPTPRPPHRPRDTHGTRVPPSNPAPEAPPPGSAHRHPPPPPPGALVPPPPHRHRPPLSHARPPPPPAPGNAVCHAPPHHMGHPPDRPPRGALDKDGHKAQLDTWTWASPFQWSLGPWGVHAFGRARRWQASG